MPRPAPLVGGQQVRAAASGTASFIRFLEEVGIGRTTEGRGGGGAHGGMGNHDDVSSPQVHVSHSLRASSVSHLPRCVATTLTHQLGDHYVMQVVTGSHQKACGTVP